MNKKNIITLRIPEELKNKIAKNAKQQGISMNQFAMYALTKEVGELEARGWFRHYLNGKTRAAIYEDFEEALSAVQDRPGPDWDS